MSKPDGDTTAPRELPDTLIETLDTLEASTLRAVSEYVDQRLEDHQVPIAEQIREEATGQVLAIEDSGAYSLVRMHPPEQEGSDGDDSIISSYRVTREKQPDGDVTLHWSFVGDVNTLEEIECANCNVTLDEYATVCPRCGEETVRHDFEE